MAPDPESMLTLYEALSCARANNISTTLTIKKGKKSGMVIMHDSIKTVLNESKFTHLLNCGDDVLYPQNFLVDLVNDNVDVIGPILRLKGNKILKYATCVENMSPELITEYIEKRTIAETDMSADHGLLIKREVLEGMAKKFPELKYKYPDGSYTYAFFLPTVIDSVFWWDIWMFCKRAMQAGFKCWTDFGVHLIHRDAESWLPLIDEEDKKEIMNAKL